jgi:hypothetical protein
MKSTLSSQQSSIIEELFTIELKSILKCCKCNYTSVKNETSMCISLPLPQKLNRIIYLNLILTNKQTIQTIVGPGYNSSPNKNQHQYSYQTISKSVFYVDSHDVNNVDRNVCVRIALNVPLNGYCSDIYEQIQNKFQLDTKRLLFLGTITFSLSLIIYI